MTTAFPTPKSVTGYQKVTPNPQRLIQELVEEDYVVLTQRPGYASEAAWKNEAERSSFIDGNSLRFLRLYPPRYPTSTRMFLAATRGGSLSPLDGTASTEGESSHADDNQSTGCSI